MVRHYRLPFSFVIKSYSTISQKSLSHYDKANQFLLKIKEKYNLNTPEDWNSITQKQILSNGGSQLLRRYTMYGLKCLACPEGKLKFDNPKPLGYWENTENILQFLKEIKEKYNLNSPEDWNSITRKHILSHGGSRVLSKYSMYELKCLACPDGKFDKRIESKPKGYWDDKENILQFLSEIKQKYNINRVEDWSPITQNQIKLHGGSRLLSKYTMYELKCMACPEFILKFDQPTRYKPTNYWDKKENIYQFLSEIKQKYNLNTPEDWNSLTFKQISENEGGVTLLNKKTLFELKCMACPDYKFDQPPKQNGYWENKENILQFLSKIKEKYNLNSPEDWNSVTQKQILSNGGSRLLSKYSMYELKCLACPDGKFDEMKPSNYWDKKENILQFLEEIKEKYNLNSPEDWDSITQKHILSHGGSRLLRKYSMYELKCIACPDGKFDKPNQSKPKGFWDIEENRNLFLEEIKHKCNLQSPQDWKRISTDQLKSFGGEFLFKKQNLKKSKVKFEIKMDENQVKEISYPLYDLIFPNKKDNVKPKRIFKRSAQRWLFLQVQKLFPGEEIVEDYFHSDISRMSGSTVQFDIFLIHKNIAIEYHGIQHYEDISAGFGALEMYAKRDREKQRICNEYGIQLIIIPYWWDNKLDSLRQTLLSFIDLK